MRRGRRNKMLGAAFVLVATLLSPVGQADAYTTTHTGNWRGDPNWFFTKRSNPLDSDLDAYMSWYVSGAWRRYRISMRAGSGTGNTDQCATNQGWLPNGTYGAGDNDSRSTFEYIQNKNWGSSVVRGSVWYIGDKWCGSKYRTELFVHSQGANGGSWTNSNYASNGCIKINQTDRTWLASRFELASGQSNGRLIVRSG